MVKEIYVKTDGRPVEVVNKGLADIWNEMGERLEILGVATTGSGRELIGELCGADTVNDEITAHKTGATFIGRKLIDRVPDTIFEIGGQDSKFISLQNGVVVDFAMNEACAAGTGSFLEEQAEKLGISIIGEFAELALSSEAPVRLGERCTVFMERDVNSYLQRGADKKALVAGLAYSIVYNYLNRLVGQRHIGDTIYFQGGTAYNDAVAAAFSMILDKDIIVPPYNGVVGAIGAALLARDKMSATGTPSRFRGWDLEQVDYKVREFTCKGCSNECDIRQFTIGEEKTYWGDKCSDRYRKRAKVDKEPVIRDLVGFRDALFYSYVTESEDTSTLLRSGTDAPRGTMGIPRTMYTYDRLPFWATFFKTCGFDIVLSRQTDKKIREMGIESAVAEPCFPIRVAHGHVAELLEAGADYVFVPNQLNEETDQPGIESHGCPWGQTLPHVIRLAPHFEDEAARFFTPTIHFRRGPEYLGRTLKTDMKRFGVPGRVVEQALKEAYEAQAEFRGRLMSVGADALSTLEEHDELGIVLVGRPYNIYDSGVNMDIPAKLRRYYGVNIIPLEFLPLWGRDTREVTPNMFWNYGRKILQAAKVVAEHPQPPHHLHDQLQVRARFLREALHGRRLLGAVLGVAVRRAHQRRRGHDAVRGIPRQQGLSALVGPGRQGRKRTGEGELGGYRDRDQGRQRQDRSRHGFGRAGGRAQAGSRARRRHQPGRDRHRHQGPYPLVVPHALRGFPDAGRGLLFHRSGDKGDARGGLAHPGTGGQVHVG